MNRSSVRLRSLAPAFLIALLLLIKLKAEEVFTGNLLQILPGRKVAEMNVKLRHVQQRGYAFFFRLSIPANLRSFYNYRLELTQTLNTNDPVEANAKARVLTQIYKAQFRALRNGRNEVATLVSTPELNNGIQLGDGPDVAEKPVQKQKKITIPTTPLFSEAYRELQASGKRIEKRE